MKIKKYIMWMKGLKLLIIVFVFIGCQNSEKNNLSISKIGRNILNHNFLTNTDKIEGVVSIGDGLKNEILDMQKHKNKTTYLIKAGDLTKPYGNNEAESKFCFI